MEGLASLNFVNTASLWYYYMKINAYKRALALFFVPYLKVPVVIGVAVYYHTGMTSLVKMMKSQLSEATQSHLDTAKQMFKTNPLLRSFKMVLPNSSSNTQFGEDGFSRKGVKVMNVKSIMNLDQDQFLGTNSQIALEPDLMDITLSDIKEFQQVKMREAQEGAYSGLEKAGLKYLDYTFREPAVHRAILDTLQGSLTDDSFVQESRDYGINIMNEAVQDKDFQHNLNNTIHAVKNDEAIKNASIGLIGNVVTHNTTRCFVTKLMTEVFTETEAKDVLIHTLTDAVVRAVQKPETNIHLGALFNSALGNQAVLEEAKSSLLYRNLYNSLTFGAAFNSFYKGNCKTEQRIHGWLQREMNTLA